MEPVPADGVPPAGDVLASVPQRGIARVIDYLIVPMTLWLALGIPTAERSGDEVTVPAWVTIVITVAFVAYETAMVAWRGQTVGKLAVGIRVADFRTGANPRVERALWRSLVVASALLVFGQFFGPLLALAIYLSAVLDPVTRRGLPDRVGGTVVVHVGAGREDWRQP